MGGMTGSIAILCAPEAVQTWHTAPELVAMGLSGLPRTERSIRRLATRAGWLRRKRPGTKAWEYHVSALPAAAQEAQAVLAAKAASPPAVPSPSSLQPALPTVPAAADPRGLADWQRRQVTARQAILDRIERDAAALGSYRRAQLAFAAAAKAGVLAAPWPDLVAGANAKRGEPGRRAVSVGTLIRWRAARETGGPEALAPAAASTAPPDWLPVFLKAWRQPTKPSVAAVHERLTGEGIALPCLRRVQRVIADLGALERNRGRMGSRALKALRAHVVRDFSDLRIGDVYTGDGHTFDAEVQHPVHGKPFRPEIVSIVDIASRRCVGWSVGLAESAWVVADALRVACVGAGIPAIWYVDRGSGFRNKEHADPVVGLLARLGITQEHSLPYNSQARGIVERFHRSCWVRAAKELPAYQGRDMDPEARKVVHLRGRREIAESGQSRYVLSWDDFLAWAGARVAAYNARPHRGLAQTLDTGTGRRRHLTPDAAWAAGVEAHAPPPAVPEAEAEDLFRPYVARRVTRATVSIGKKTYYARELEAADLHGRTVAVGIDIHDPRRVTVRDLDGRLIGAAELDGNLHPYFARSAVEEAQDRRAAGRERRLAAGLEEVRAERAGAAIEADWSDVEDSVTPLFPERPRIAMAEPEPEDEDPDAAFWDQFGATMSRLRRATEGGGSA